MAEKRIGYVRFVTVLVKELLQFRCEQVLHLGILHGCIESFWFLSLGSLPGVAWELLLGRSCSLIKMSKSCSVVGFISALTSIFRSDG